MIACALGLPGLAAAQDFPNAATGMQVKTDDGAVVGQVEQVTRDRHGRIRSARLSPGAEPASAPAGADLVAETPQMQLPARYDTRQAEAEPQRLWSGGAPNTALR